MQFSGSVVRCRWGMYRFRWGWRGRCCWTGRSTRCRWRQRRGVWWRARTEGARRSTRPVALLVWCWGMGWVGRQLWDSRRQIGLRSWSSFWKILSILIPWPSFSTSPCFLLWFSVLVEEKGIVVFCFCFSIYLFISDLSLSLACKCGVT